MLPRETVSARLNQSCRLRLEEAFLRKTKDLETALFKNAALEQDLLFERQNADTRCAYLETTILNNGLHDSVVVSQRDDQICALKAEISALTADLGLCKSMLNFVGANPLSSTGLEATGAGSGAAGSAITAPSAAAPPPGPPPPPPPEGPTAPHDGTAAATAPPLEQSDTPSPPVKPASVWAPEKLRLFFQAREEGRCDGRLFQTDRDGFGKRSVVVLSPNSQAGREGVGGRDERHDLADPRHEAEPWIYEVVALAMSQCDGGGAPALVAVGHRGGFPTSGSTDFLAADQQEPERFLGAVGAEQELYHELRRLLHAKVAVEAARFRQTKLENRARTMVRGAISRGTSGKPTSSSGKTEKRFPPEKQPTAGGKTTTPSTQQDPTTESSVAGSPRSEEECERNDCAKKLDDPTDHDRADDPADHDRDNDRVIEPGDSVLHPDEDPFHLSATLSNTVLFLLQEATSQLDTTSGLKKHGLSRAHLVTNVGRAWGFVEGAIAQAHVLPASATWRQDPREMNEEGAKTKAAVLHQHCGRFWSKCSGRMVAALGAAVGAALSPALVMVVANWSLVPCKD